MSENKYPNFWPLDENNLTINNNNKRVESCEWLKLLADDNNDDNKKGLSGESELLLPRLSTAESIAAESCCSGSSILWADDAIESSSTEQLKREWDKIEKCFQTGVNNETVSESVFNEVLLWRRAFPQHFKENFIMTEELSHKKILEILKKEEENKSSYISSWLTESSQQHQNYEEDNKDKHNDMISTKKVFRVQRPISSLQQRSKTNNIFRSDRKLCSNSNNNEAYLNLNLDKLKESD